ncbi:hypothetical protein CY34DRAFT_798348 [Suillus luteus UH-Slu-Lm8-n1]|uniref:Unplaced genomic scaffold CY34scaffold_8, whole genome shotgun sequence n=1 Tax=Suillus luteus UH-Slu-Lm8-n1 TaxID=930992 RepID=A0A0D0BRE2_9AGAM|nr:hypothetical protein CY34DRAFT_798348 [Suillus luteus UH-Slu-Lm8-n1]
MIPSYSGMWSVLKEPFACDSELMVAADTTSIPVLSTRAQTDIDNELEAMEERMRALRTRRNNFSPISSIPPEILGTIFVQHAQQMQLLHVPDNPAVLSWLKVGHICRHWREVALGTPELWATPFLNSSRATEEMLMRSKMAPLNLRCGQRYRMDSVQKALMHIDRLQEVSLPFLNGGITYRWVMEFLNKLSSCSAPRLQSLSLEEEFAQTLRIAIPISFVAPNLRSLQLKYCNLSWASSVLTGLTVLNIKKLSPECLPTLEELISALRRMPGLRFLELEDALPTLPPQTMSLSRAPPAMNVRLPHLKRLRLVAKILDVANVLAHIELPDSAMLEVQIGCRPSLMNANQEWNLSLPIISHALESCFKAKSCRTPRSMRLFAAGRIHVQYSTVRNPSSWVGSMSETCLDPEWAVEHPVMLDFDFPNETSTAILSDLWRLVPIKTLEALYIEGFFSCWDGFWTDLLGRGAAPNLAYLNLRETPQALEDLIISLRSTHSSTRSIGWRAHKELVFSPALSHLVLASLEFDTSFSTFTRASDLLDVLIDRVNEGRGLDYLSITGCTCISAHDVRLLREVVADVQWDEYESFDDFDLAYDYDSLEEDDDDDDYDFYDAGDHYY